MRYVEEFQRSRWPRAAVTRRAQGGYGAIRRQDSSPMLWHRIRPPSLSGTRKPPVRGRTPLLQHPSSESPFDSGLRQEDQKGSLNRLVAVRVHPPLGGGMVVRPNATPSDGNGRDTQGDGDIRIGGGA